MECSNLLSYLGDLLETPRRQMPTLSHVVVAPYLYEILHTSTLIQRITRHDLEGNRFREVSYDDLPEDVQDKILREILE